MNAYYFISSCTTKRILSSFVILLFGFPTLIWGQDHNHLDGDHDHATCISKETSECREIVRKAFDDLTNNQSFQTTFQRKYMISFSEFIELNEYEMPSVFNYVENKICYLHFDIKNIGDLVFEVIEKTKINYLFERTNLSSTAEMF